MLILVKVLCSFLLLLLLEYHSFSLDCGKQSVTFAQTPPLLSVVFHSKWIGIMSLVHCSSLAFSSVWAAHCFPSWSRETRKKITLKLSFLVCFSNEILSWPWSCFSKSPVFSHCFHTETTIIVHHLEHRKMWIGLYADENPCWLLGIFWNDILLTNWSASGGELTGWSGSNIKWTINHAEKKTRGRQELSAKAVLKSSYEQWGGSY